MFASISASALILALALAPGADAKRPQWDELEGYTFDQYVADFHLPISSNSSSYAAKKATFMLELERVRKHNKAGLPWKESINKYSLLTAVEKKGTFGRSKGAKSFHQPKSLKVIFCTVI